MAKVYYIGDTSIDSVDRTNTYLVNTYNQIVNLLVAAGLSLDTAKIAAAATAHETDGYKSNVLKANNNASGIIWINKPYQNATQGTPFPSKEGKAYYAKYANFSDWAKDYVRILSLKNRPIDATTPEDFVHQLKANAYFTGNENNYLQGVNRYLAIFPALKASENEAVALQQTRDAIPDPSGWPTWAKALGISLGAIIAAKLIR